MPRNKKLHRHGLAGRVFAPAIAGLMLASCQTTAQDTAAQGDAGPVETADAAGKASASGAAAAKAYVDPLVVSATNAAATPPAVSPAVAAAYAPTPGPADLGELTMQPTSVNANRNSLFSATAAAPEEPVAPAAAAPASGNPQAVAAATNAAGSASPSIVVTSDLPTRQVNPMSRSLFSADLREQEPPVVEEAALPAATADEMPVYSSEEQPVYDPAEPYVEDQSAQPAAPEVATETPAPEEPKKRKWLPSLAEIFGKKKS